MGYRAVDIHHSACGLKAKLKYLIKCKLWIAIKYTVLQTAKLALCYIPVTHGVL